MCSPCLTHSNAVTKTCYEGLPAEKSEFGQDLANALVEQPDSELEPVVAYLTKKHGMDRLSARVKARSDYRRNGIIRSRTFAVGKQFAGWDATRAKWEQRAATARQDHVRCCIRPQSSKLEGTLEQMDAARSCIEKVLASRPKSHPLPLQSTPASPAG